MVYVLAGVAAVILMAVVVYIRYMARRHVASLFSSTVRKLMSRGIGMETAMRQAIGSFVRRAPFNLIKPDELSGFISVLQDLNSPIDVGAEILQKCENKHSISQIRNCSELTRLAYLTDMRVNLMQLIRNAKSLQQKVPKRFPNITIALLASLSVREGWTFIEEQNDGLIFDYRQERIRIPKHGSGKDAVRLILFEEMAQRPMPPQPESNLNARRSARQELIDNFDNLFEDAFLHMAKTE